MIKEKQTGPYIYIYIYIYIEKKKESKIRREVNKKRFRYEKTKIDYKY